MPTQSHRHEPAPPLPSRVAAVRRFNRFYTRLIGALDEGHLHTALSLAHVRVLYELAHREAPTAAELASELRLDPGYLSRMLLRFEKDGLVERTRSASDARRAHLRLTESGRFTFAELDARAGDDIARLLGPLDDAEQRRLLDAMRAVESILGGDSRHASAFLLRDPRPGDMGWIVHRQAVLYFDEYGWSEEYEALIARIVADFVERLDPARERCWIAERDDQVVGSVFVVKHPEHADVAKLRLLYVEPSARGLGIGGRLVREVTQYARRVGYRKVTLWTNSVLVSARRIYEAEGYRLVDSTPHHKFGQDLVGETWELAL